VDLAKSTADKSCRIPPVAPPEPLSGPCGSSSSIAKVAEREGVSARYVRRLMRLAFLAPKIVDNDRGWQAAARAHRRGLG
jgi:hypothetical protein